MGVCCRGGCRFHLQTSAEIALTHLHLVLALVSPAVQPRERAQIPSGMGNAWLMSSQELIAVRLQAAINCLKETAQIHLRAGEGESWGREEFSLGNSYCELSEETSSSKWMDGKRAKGASGSGLCLGNP
jgi:hypothetical protein